MLLCLCMACEMCVSETDGMTAVSEQGSGGALVTSPSQRPYPSSPLPSKAHISCWKSKFLHILKQNDTIN